MTTGAQVRTVWQDNIFNAPSVAAFTSRGYLYDVLADSQFEAAKLYHDPQDGGMPQVNFFVCLVRRAQRMELLRGLEQTFEVRLTYYLQQTDVGGPQYNLVADRLELVDDLVRTALGKTWGGTVDYYTGGEPDRIDVAAVDDRQCWRGGATYLGFKAITF